MMHRGYARREHLWTHSSSVKLALLLFGGRLNFVLPAKEATKDVGSQLSRRGYQSQSMTFDGARAP
jgi:hypothetical protein